MLSMTNATADFERRVEREVDDAYGGTRTVTEWQPAISGVECRFEARGTRFVTEGGERVRRPSKLYAPLHVDDQPIEEGSRVTVQYRGTERTYRIISYDPRTSTAGFGFLALDLEDWGDTE